MFFAKNTAKITKNQSILAGMAYPTFILVGTAQPTWLNFIIQSERQIFYELSLTSLLMGFTIFEL